MAGPLPRLVYVGDIPVEETYQSSVQLYRLFERYPPHLLQVIETKAESQFDLRLRGVAYESLPTFRPGWLPNRFRGLSLISVALAAKRRSRDLLRLVGDFQPEAVVTLTGGLGWLVAAEFAGQQALPLHLILHDDWPKLGAHDRLAKSWLRRHFGRVFRLARSRLCVSPFMVEDFERRYGVAGSVLYPSRSDACPTFEARAPRRIDDSEPIVVGYCGGSGSHVMPGLRELATVTQAVNGKLVVFGPFGDALRHQLHSISRAIEFRGFVPYAAMIAGLRAESDVLFAPMTFDGIDRDSMAVSFPSKLVDYTALGLPILVYGPADSATVRWAALHDSAAEVVSEEGSPGLQRALMRLRRDPARRGQLSAGALRAGAAFAPEPARERFYAALACSR